MIHTNLSKNVSVVIMVVACLLAMQACKSKELPPDFELNVRTEWQDRSQTQAQLIAKRMKPEDVASITIKFNEGTGPRIPKHTIKIVDKKEIGQFLLVMSKTVRSKDFVRVGTFKDEVQFDDASGKRLEWFRINDSQMEFGREFMELLLSYRKKAESKKSA